MNGTTQRSAPRYSAFRPAVPGRFRKRRRIQGLHAAAIWLAALCASAAWQPAQATPTVVRMDINNEPIGPATLDYLERALQQAIDTEARALLIFMDSPGGLLESTRSMVSRILRSPVPIIIYVAPAGARAASAGTFLLYAAHVSAMAPTTHVGAATPVQLHVGEARDEWEDTPRQTEQPEEQRTADQGGEPRPDAADNQQARSGQRGNDADSSRKLKNSEASDKTITSEEAMMKKITNDSVAYIRGLAERRGRNPDWAEQAVREAVSITAREALELNIIDLVAANTRELLNEIDGMEVLMEDGPTMMATADAAVVVYAPDLRYRILALISHPAILSILLSVGLIGILVEIQNPGLILPGVVGLIALVLLLYGTQVLPIGQAWLILVALGLFFIILEFFIPSMGILAIGGSACLALGMVMTLRESLDVYNYITWLFGLLLFAVFALVSLLIVLMRRLYRRPAMSGAEEMVGSVGTVLKVDGKGCLIHLHSETWKGRCEQPLQIDQQVQVKSIHGLTLDLEALPTEE